MGTYKAEFLAHHYKGRLRPAAHYSMGWLPVAAPLAARAPGLVNAAGRAPVPGRAIKLAGRDAGQGHPGAAARAAGGHAGGTECTWPSCSSNCLKSPPDRCRAAGARRRTGV